MIDAILVEKKDKNMSAIFYLPTFLILYPISLLLY